MQYLGTYRTGNSIAYKSPNWNGFSGAVLLEIDEKNNVDVTKKKKGVDGWNLGLNYENGPLSVGLGYLDRPEAGGSPVGSQPTGQYQMTGISGGLFESSHHGWSLKLLDDCRARREGDPPMQIQFEAQSLLSANSDARLSPILQRQ